MKMNFKTVVAPALILCAICLCVTALLALTNELTKDKITQAALEKESNSRMLVMSTADDFEENENYYTATSGGEVVGYVFSTSSSGYGGDVSVMTGIDIDGNITGVVILSQEETPGLGANCENESFLVQFLQKAVTLEVVKNTTASDGEIEAMTGATITTTAVTNAVNVAVEIFETIGGAN
ncbi:MAG: RnfABCDGE type electron transport complex subunit G [Clostridia bacterium]